MTKKKAKIPEVFSEKRIKTCECGTHAVTEKRQELNSRKKQQESSTYCEQRGG